MIRWGLSFWLFFLLWCGPLQADGVMDKEWLDFKETFMTEDGRIIDWQNSQQSHSEGQGYAMLLAVLFNDRPAFDLLFTWSENNLGNGIRAWQWGNNGTSWGVLDSNNATDGDMLHSWALFLAGEKWKSDSYTAAARKILDEIRKELIVHETLILPGRMGFVKPDGIALNLSYYIFPALLDFARFDADNALLWKGVYQKGLSLFAESAHQDTGLVPDWIRSSLEGVLISPPPDAIFGYEAIRVPLYLLKAKEIDSLKKMKPIVQRVAREEYMADLLSLDGTAASPHEALAGNYAVFACVASSLGMKDDAEILWKIAERRKSEQKGNYYGTVLYLLALLS